MFDLKNYNFENSVIPKRIGELLSQGQAMFKVCASNSNQDR